MTSSDSTWLDELQSLEQRGLLRSRRESVPLADGWVLLDGERLRNFGGNDYLNLAGDPRVKQAARDALEQFPAGATASALVVGRTAAHAELESTLAEFERQQAAVLFPTGFAANLGVISSLVTEQDVVFCDRLNHASLVDACRLSGGKLRVYRHQELSILERELSKSGEYRRRWIVTDALFSMDGDLAPLPELVEIAREHNAKLIVDEAHGTGVFGENGRGVSEYLGVEEQIDVRVGTLSKAIGALGGFVSGEQSLCDWLWNSARTQMFSTALPPMVCAAACRAVQIIRDEPQRRIELLANAERFRTAIVKAGGTIPAGCCGPIVPIILGEPDRAVEVSRQLAQQGYFVPAIRPPTVPNGTSRLRVTLTSAHTADTADALADLLAEIGLDR